jgi:phosphoesterase RecJ-like protein
VCAEFTLPSSHTFLPKSGTIEKGLRSLQKFVITVDTKEAKLDSLSYDIDGDELHIYLTPKNNFYQAKDVRAAASEYAHDAIITIAVSRLKDLGPLYDDNLEFFYHTPLLNIDHRSANDRYGHVNLIDLVASSTSEIVFELVKRLGFENLDEQVATSLLTGIISKTKVFQSHAVTPRSLAVASHLIAAGARRDEIIKNLYQTKTLNTLQLWGRALTRLKISSDKRVVWTTVLAGDLQHLQTTAADAAGVLDELMVNAPDADTMILFVESKNTVDVYLVHKPAVPLPKLPDGIVVKDQEYASGPVDGTLEQVQSVILSALGVPSAKHNNSASRR